MSVKKRVFSRQLDGLNLGEVTYLLAISTRNVDFRVLHVHGGASNIAREPDPPCIVRVIYRSHFVGGGQRGRPSLGIVRKHGNYVCFLQP